MIRGQVSRPRDELGRRIPRDGTKSAAIYAMLKDNRSARDIHAALGGSRTSINVLIYKICNPERANRLFNG